MMKNGVKLDRSDSKKYEVEVIWDSKLYARKLEGHFLPGFITWYRRKATPKKTISMSLCQQYNTSEADQHLL